MPCVTPITNSLMNIAATAPFLINLWILITGIACGPLQPSRFVRLLAPEKMLIGLSTCFARQILKALLANNSRADFRLTKMLLSKLNLPCSTLPWTSVWRTQSDDLARDPHYISPRLPHIYLWHYRHYVLSLLLLNICCIFFKQSISVLFLSTVYSSLCCCNNLISSQGSLKSDLI